MSEPLLLSDNVSERSLITAKCTRICDRICENRPSCTHYRNWDSTMSDVIEVWSRSGENLEVIACMVFKIQSLEARSRLI